MSNDPLADVVSAQYEAWVYPEPIHDLPAWLEHNWQWFDPIHAHGLFWPDRPYPSGLRILVAGCGANQAAVLAATNPTAHVVGIDVSPTSLAHHERLARDNDLDNLELHRLPIEQVGTLGREFDLVVSTGVLHHLADPQAGADALASVLARDGVLALMLYAHFGRIGVEILESVFADLGLRQDEASVAMVTSALGTLAAEHPVRPYMAIAPDLAFDGGIVDTFLHGRQRSYTVPDCLELVERAGLVFQDWLFTESYEPPYGSQSVFHAAIAGRPDVQRWSIMERLNTVNACHFFFACRPERDPSTYRVDLHGPSFRDLIPGLRAHCWRDGADLVKPGGRRTLSATQQAIVDQIDGRRSIGAIVTNLAIVPGPAQLSTPDRESVVRQTLAMLVHNDFVQLALPTT